MIYKIELYAKKKDYKRNTYYIPTDITNEVVMPIVDVQRLDKPLDTSSLVLYRESHKVIRPFSRVIIRINYGDKQENIYRLVQSDTVEIATFGGNNLYKHDLELIEPTKWLERFIIDNTTITNLLAFLYGDSGLFIPTPAPYEVKYKTASGTVRLESVNYTNDNRYFQQYFKNTLIQVNVGMSVKGSYGIFHIPCTLLQNGYRIYQPDGTVINIDYNSPTYATDKFDLYQVGKYRIERDYNYTMGNDVLHTTIVWETNVKEKVTVPEKKPTRYTIKEVLEKILSKVSNETSAPRKNLDSPLFKLDKNLDFLEKEFSPEFTFTQNTLFGVLEQIGNYIHAIPRLIPSFNGADDYSNWDTITYDFLGDREQETLDNYEIVTEDYSLDADNYTSGFVSNVENSFQTNNIDYISMTEPSRTDYVSTRTEDGNFEISNDNAVIKTSRPIQRIISLTCVVPDLLAQDPLAVRPIVLDLSKYVKEQTEYSLLKDYAFNSGDIEALNTKSTALYYTRGQKEIRGLTYIPPTEFNISIVEVDRAILNIINLEYNALATGKKQNLKLKDLAFKISYVPFHSLKAKQYKSYIDEDSGENELYYNQEAQSVDIEAFGENVRGALMMTGNVDKSVTGYVKDPTNQIHIGKLLNDYYYIYQINREFIDNEHIKATVRLSKNFNKMNGYLGIKKNYREWEISNRECIETNPIINQFCIITTNHDFDKIDALDISAEEKQSLKAEYKEDLVKNEGFISNGGLVALREALVGQYAILPISTAEIKTKTQELDFNDEAKTIERKGAVPASAFGMGLSIVLNFTAQDNYALNTYSKEVSTNKNYQLEEYVPYGNKYGNVDEMLVSFEYRVGLDVENYGEIINKAKKLYNMEGSSFNADFALYPIKFWNPDYPILVNKDSRQKLSLTAQLNFVTDNPNIWISPNIVKESPLISVIEPEPRRGRSRLRYVYFKNKPSQFVKGLDVKDLIRDADGNVISNDAKAEYDSNSVSLKVTCDSVIPQDCVGIGLIKKKGYLNIDIDNTAKLMIYYNKAYKQGDSIENLYLELRRKI